MDSLLKLSLSEDGPMGPTASWQMADLAICPSDSFPKGSRAEGERQPIVEWLSNWVKKWRGIFIRFLVFYGDFKSSIYWESGGGKTEWVLRVLVQVSGRFEKCNGCLMGSVMLFGGSLERKKRGLDGGISIEDYSGFNENCRGFGAP